MIFYVAAGFEDQQIARDVAKRLEEGGHRICASWMTMGKCQTPEEHRRMAERCLDDVAYAEGFVIVNPKERHRNGSGGRYVELGAALAARKKIYALGEPENSFTYLRRVVFARDVDHMLQLIDRGVTCQNADKSKR